LQARAVVPRFSAETRLHQAGKLLRPLRHPPDEALGLQEDRLDGTEEWHGYAVAATTCPRRQANGTRSTRQPRMSLTGETEDTHQRLAYRAFVESALVETEEEFADVIRNSPWGIGSEAFQEKVRSTYLILEGEKEQRIVRKKPMYSPEQILRVVAERFGERPDELRKRRYRCGAQAVLVYLLTRFGGMNQEEAARWTGVGSGAAVSVRIQRLRSRMVADAKLAERVREAEKELLGDERNVDC